MRNKIMQDWMDHQDVCMKCQFARSVSDMCETGKAMSPAVEQEIRHSMAEELEPENVKREAMTCVQDVLAMIDHIDQLIEEIDA